MRMLTDDEHAALEAVRARVAAPPQEIRRADAAVLVAALDRLLADPVTAGEALPARTRTHAQPADLERLADGLNALLAQIGAGDLSTDSGHERRLEGALAVSELLAHPDLSAAEVVARLGQD